MSLYRSLALPVFALMCSSAQAQFALVTQSASATAVTSSGSSQLLESTPGDVGSLSLSATSGFMGSNRALGSSGTVVESSRMGISAGTGVTVVAATPTGGGNTGGYYNGGYYNGGYTTPIYGSGQATASAVLSFDVLASTDVRVDVTDLYRPGVNMTGFPSFSSTLSLSRLDAQGQWVSVVDRNNLGSLSHLDAGRYQLSSSFKYSLVAPSGLAGGGASLSIQAVPEPGTWALMGLGLMGLAWVQRRRTVS
jgi:PEP-CTERM motif